MPLKNVERKTERYIHHSYFVIFTSRSDQTPLGIRVVSARLSPKWIPILLRRVQKYTSPYLRSFSVGGPTHGETNEARGTPPDFDYRR